MPKYKSIALAAIASVAMASAASPQSVYASDAPSSTSALLELYKVRGGMSAQEFSQKVHAINMTHRSSLQRMQPKLESKLYSHKQSNERLGCVDEESSSSAQVPSVQTPVENGGEIKFKKIQARYFNGKKRTMIEIDTRLLEDDSVEAASTKQIKPELWRKPVPSGNNQDSRTVRQNLPTGINQQLYQQFLISPSKGLARRIYRDVRDNMGWGEYIDNHPFSNVNRAYASQGKANALVFAAGLRYDVGDLARVYRQLSRSEAADRVVLESLKEDVKNGIEVGAEKFVVALEAKVKMYSREIASSPHRITGPSIAQTPNPSVVLASPRPTPSPIQTHPTHQLPRSPQSVPSPTSIRVPVVPSISATAQRVAPKPLPTPLPSPTIRPIRVQIIPPSISPTSRPSPDAASSPSLYQVRTPPSAVPSPRPTSIAVPSTQSQYQKRVSPTGHATVPKHVTTQPQKKSVLSVLKATPVINWKHLQNVVNDPRYKGSIDDLFQHGFGRSEVGDVEFSKSKRYILIRKHVERDYAGCEEQNVRLLKYFAGTISKRDEKKIVLMYNAKGVEKILQANANAQAKKTAKQAQSSKPASVLQTEKRKQAAYDAFLNRVLYQYPDPQGQTSVEDVAKTQEPAQQAPIVRNQPCQVSGGRLDIQRLNAALSGKKYSNSDQSKVGTVSKVVTSESSGRKVDAQHQGDSISARSGNSRLDIRYLGQSVRRDAVESQGSYQDRYVHSVDSGKPNNARLDVGSLRQRLQVASPSQNHYSTPGREHQYRDSSAMSSPRMSPEEFRVALIAIEKTFTRAYSHQLRGISKDIVDPLQAALIKFNPYKLRSDGRPDYTNSQLAEQIKDMMYHSVRSGPGGFSVHDHEVYHIASQIINDTFHNSVRLRRTFFNRYGREWSSINEGCLSNHSVANLVKGFDAIRYSTRGDYTKQRDSQNIKTALFGLLLW